MSSRKRHNKSLGHSLQKRQPEKQIPFPGLIDGNKWTIKEGKYPPFVRKNDDGYLMQVPMGDSAGDRRIRLHEESHIAFTLPEIEKYTESGMPQDVQFDTLNAVEDARVAIKLANISPEYDELNREVDILTRDMRSGFRQQFLAQREAVINYGNPEYRGGPPNLLDIARLIAASKGYQEEDFFESCADESEFGFLNEIVDELYGQHFGKDNPEFEDTVNFAKNLEERVDKIQQQMMAAAAERNALLNEANMDHVDQNGRGLKHPNKNAAWGTMKIVSDLPLTERMPKGIKSYQNRATDQGFVPVNWHRLATDKRVFNRRKTRQVDCGTILVDQSGSMSLSVQEMQQIIAKWPGVLIAGYSGAGNRESGELRILAKNGRMVNERDLPPTCGGLNIIDGPALNWLAKQKGPRIWISDGLVTGIGENRNQSHILDAARIVKKGRITRISDVREILREE